MLSLTVRRAALRVTPFLVIALTSCAKGKEKGGPTGPNALDGPISGGWSGTTSQGRIISILVTDGGIPLIMVSSQVVGTACTSTVTSFLPREAPDEPYAVTNNAFSMSHTSSTRTTTLAGTFTPSGTASGTITVNHPQCMGTLNGTWTATKATGPEINVTGTWNGTFASNLVPTTDGVLTLTQSGSNVSGTYTVATGAVGTVSGTVTGRMAAITLNQTTQGCTGSFNGHAVLHTDPEFLAYFYAGSDCLGTHAKGGGSASR